MKVSDLYSVLDDPGNQLVAIYRAPSKNRSASPRLYEGSAVNIPIELCDRAIHRVGISNTKYANVINISIVPRQSKRPLRDQEDIYLDILYSWGSTTRDTYDTANTVDEVISKIRKKYAQNQNLGYASVWVKSPDGCSPDVLIDAEELYRDSDYENRRREDIQELWEEYSHA